MRRGESTRRADSPRRKPRRRDVSLAIAMAPPLLFVAVEDFDMLTRTVLCSLALAAILGCGASIPPPNERLAAAEAAARGAREVGAEKNPQAALYLKLTDDQ